MRLAVLNLTRKSQFNALIYGVLLGAVFTSIISFFAFIKQEHEHREFIHFLSAVDFLPGMHPGAQK